MDSKPTAGGAKNESIACNIHVYFFCGVISFCSEWDTNSAGVMLALSNIIKVQIEETAYTLVTPDGKRWEGYIYSTCMSYKKKHNVYFEKISY
jgi:pantoate kinase|tara:strand:- start:725 stop:1003 length:279 start_codon:yes stop_codon:yes gene_type:complete